MERCSTKMSNSEFDDWRTFFFLVAFLNKIGLKVINKYHRGRRGCFTSHCTGSEIVCSVVCLFVKSGRGSTV